jgi:hypothetical protein
VTVPWGSDRSPPAMGRARDRHGMQADPPGNTYGIRSVGAALGAWRVAGPPACGIQPRCTGEHRAAPGNMQPDTMVERNNCASQGKWALRSLPLVSGCMRNRRLSSHKHRRHCPYRQLCQRSRKVLSVLPRYTRYDRQTARDTSNGHAARRRFQRDV